MDSLKVWLAVPVTVSRGFGLAVLVAAFLTGLLA